MNVSNGALIRGGFPWTSPVLKYFEGLAKRNAIARLIRCLFAEKLLDEGLIEWSKSDKGARYNVGDGKKGLVFERLARLPASVYVNEGKVFWDDGKGRVLEIETPETLFDVIKSFIALTPDEDGMKKLKEDMKNSVMNDALARWYRTAWMSSIRSSVTASGKRGFVGWLRGAKSAREAAIILDQWGALEGHPFYPTWKTKPDLDFMDVMALSPEFNAIVPVRMAALQLRHAYVEKMSHVRDVHEWFRVCLPELWSVWEAGVISRGGQVSDWLPLPIHSWHLQNHVLEAYSEEISAGILVVDGPDFYTRPTMSFRTMLPLQPDGAPFVKLPVAIWLTSEQRSLQAKSIHMGPRISDLINRIIELEAGIGDRMEIFPEELAFHYKNQHAQQDSAGRHLSVAFRSNSAFDRNDGLLPVTVAALLSEGLDGIPLISEFVGNLSEGEACSVVCDFFREYAKTVIFPVVAIYMLYGVALEAHQQNTMIMFDDQGCPRKILVRDFGDGRTFVPWLEERGLGLKPYVHPGILPTTFSDDPEPVRSFVIDACFVCHLNEVASLLTETYRLPEMLLWKVMREETDKAFLGLRGRVDSSVWNQEREVFMERPWSTRSVLTMHLLKYSDYRLQHELPNPLSLEAHTSG